MEFLQAKLEDWTGEKLTCMCLIKFLEILEPPTSSSAWNKKFGEFRNKWDAVLKFSRKKVFLVCYAARLQPPESVGSEPPGKKEYKTFIKTQHPTFYQLMKNNMKSKHDLLPLNMTELIFHPLIQDIFLIYGEEVTNFILLKSFTVVLLQGELLSVVVCHPASSYFRMPFLINKNVTEQNNREDTKENCANQQTVFTTQQDAKRKAEDSPLGHPCKRVKVSFEDDSKVIAPTTTTKSKTRWITPSQQIVDRLLAERSQSNSSSNSNSLSSSNKCYYFIKIDKDTSFPGAYLKHTKKQVYRWNTNIPLPPELNGLRLPREIENFEKGTPFFIIILTVSETKAKDLKLRIQPKKRCRKRFTQLHSQGSSCVVISSDPSQESFGKKVASPRNTSYSPILLDCNYDPKLSLKTPKILYNQSAWSSWPKKHILYRIKNTTDLKTCAELLVSDIISHKIGLFVLPDIYEHVDLLETVFTPFIKFSKRCKNLTSLLKSCCTFSKRKIERKQDKKVQRRKSKRPVYRPVDDIIQLSGPIAHSTPENPITGPLPEVIDLTVDSTTASSSGDSVAISSHELKESDRSNSNKGNSQLNRNVSSASKFSGSGSSNNVIAESPALGPTKKYVLKNMEDVSHNQLMLALKQLLHMNGLGKLLGSESNRKGFFKFVRRSVFTAGTKSCLTLERLVECLDYRKVDWLKTAATNKDVKFYLFTKVVSWIYCQYVLMVIRINFYVTEVSRMRNQVHFFWRDEWKSASARQKNHNLRNAILKPLETLGDGDDVECNMKVRFIPKSRDGKTHFRMLTKRLVTTQNMRQLRSTLNFMNAKLTPHLISDPNQMRIKWILFLKKWKINKFPKLYYVRVDVQSAYPSVNLHKLEELIENFPLPDANTIHFKTFKTLGDKPLNLQLLVDSRYKKRCISTSVLNRPMVLQDTEMENNVDFTTLKRQLTASFSQPNIMSMGKQKFEFNHGLPQGWGLSESLCNFYLANAEKDHLSRFTSKSTNDFYGRSVDDFLFISPNQLEAKKFWKKMQAGIPEYHIQMNQDKGEHNIECEITPISQSQCNPVVLCGWRFCLRSGHVSRDYSSYAGQDIASTVAYYMRSSSPEQLIYTRMKCIAPARLAYILLDPCVNCTERILLSVFEAALILAFRFGAFCRVMFKDYNALKKRNLAIHLSGSILKASSTLGRFCATTLKFLKTRKRLFNCNPHKCCCCLYNRPNVKTQEVDANLLFTNSINVHEFKYIALRAFVLKLKVHSSAYSEILPRVRKFIKNEVAYISKKRYVFLKQLTAQMPEHFMKIKI